MKNKNILFWIIAGFFALLTTAFAQDFAPPLSPNEQAAGILTYLTPVIVPLVIAGLKKVLPSVPSFLLPLIAPLLGIALDYINHFATGQATNLIASIALGAAGVGVREAVDQLKSIKPVPPVA